MGSPHTGTVLLLASNRHTGINLSTLHHNWFSQLHFHFHFSHQLTNRLRINMTSYPEYVLNHLQNLTNFSPVHNLPNPMFHENPPRTLNVAHTTCLSALNNQLIREVCLEDDTYHIHTSNSMFNNTATNNVS